MDRVGSQTPFRRAHDGLFELVRIGRDVSGGVNSRNVGRLGLIDDDAAFVVERDAEGRDERSVRVGPDRDENAFARNGRTVLEQHVLHAHEVSPNLRDGAVEPHFHVGMFENLFYPNVLGLEGVFANENGDLGTKFGQIERFGRGGVASSDDDDLAAFEEVSVAGGAIRNPRTEEFRFSRSTESAVLVSGGEKDVFRLNGFSSGGRNGKRAFRPFD